MRIFKDLITGDEMFSDSSKYSVTEDCLYEVECRTVIRKEGEIVLPGSNPSAEEADEGTEECVESGLDVVLNQRLQEIDFDKKQFKEYLKSYTKSLQEKWKEEEWSDDKIAEAKAKITTAAKIILPKVGDLKFYTGESFNPDGALGMLDYRENADGTETPLMYFFKHGLIDEKV